MKRLINHKLSITFFALIAVMLFVVGCSDNSVVNPEQQKGPNFFTRVTALQKDPVSVGAWIGPYGGAVGGYASYGNKVSIPPFAVNRYTYITLDIPNPAISQLDFGPSMQFSRPVSITCSYADFNVGDPYKIKVYWYNPSTGKWELIGTPSVDTGSKTVTFSTSHFSKYGFGDGG